MLAQCHICSLILQLNHVKGHLKYFHKYDGIFRYKCAVTSCGRFFSNTQSLQRHANNHPDYPISKTRARFHTQGMLVSVESINDMPGVEKKTTEKNVTENCTAGSHINPPNRYSDVDYKAQRELSFSIANDVSMAVSAIDNTTSTDYTISQSVIENSRVESHTEPLNYYSNLYNQTHRDVSDISGSTDRIEISRVENNISQCFVGDGYSEEDTQAQPEINDFFMSVDAMNDIAPAVINISDNSVENDALRSHMRPPNCYSNLYYQMHRGVSDMSGFTDRTEMSSIENNISQSFVEDRIAGSDKEFSERYSDHHSEKQPKINDFFKSVNAMNDISPAVINPSGNSVENCAVESHMKPSHYDSGLYYRIPYHTNDDIVVPIDPINNSTAKIDIPRTIVESRTSPHDHDARSLKKLIDKREKVDTDCSDSKLNYIELLKQKALALTLDFSADPSLSRIQVQRIVEKFEAFINDDEVNKLKNRVLQLIAPEKRLIGENYFRTFQSIFSDLNSEYKRLALLKKDGYFIKPVSNFIGTMEVSRQNGTMLTKNIFSQYIPIKETLKSYLGNIQLFNKIYKYWCDVEQNVEDTENIIQAKFWKSKHQDKEKIVFPLFLYQDDFETGNPLGSKAGLHKLCGVYMTIGCVPPEYRSKLVNIFLVLLCHAADVKNYDNNIIYGPLIQDLNHLASDGIELKFNDRTVQVYFKLAVIIGDNLGLNSTLGFTESFSANYSCRFCKTAKNNSREYSTEIHCVMRDKDNYNEDLARNCLSETGIRHSCVWNRVTDFHAVENYSVDIMRDLLEGVCKIEMAGLLKNLICKKKYFSLNTLNDRIKYFERSVTSNAPPLISTDDLTQSRIKMTASEMKAFVLNGGIIFGDLIRNENDEHWKLYKLLRKILCVCLKRSISSGTPRHLEMLIEEHHSQYIKLYGKTLKPKHHNMLHYGRIMREIGPLRHLWAMRFEAKHRPSKKNAAVVFSRINICKTLAIQHQLYFGKAMIKNEFLDDEIICETVNDTAMQSSWTIRSLPDDFHRYKIVKKLTMVNTKYKINDVILIAVEELPVFGQIQNIGMKDKDTTLLEVSDFLFIVKVFKTVRYSEQFQAQMVIATETMDCVKFNHKHITKVSVTLMSDGNKYIVYD